MTRSLIGVVISPMVAAALVAGGLMVAPASAQTNTPSKRQLARQRRVIAEQQREIRAYQRQLATQSQQTSPNDTGLLGSFGCPRGYTYSLVGEGCYPDLPAQVIVIPRR